MPPQPIESAEINKSIPKEQIKPFAKLRFELVRTYTTAACSTEAPATTTEGNLFSSNLVSNIHIYQHILRKEMQPHAACDVNYSLKA